MKINAVILDMDGLMIDSEPFWRQAEIEEFAKVGLNLTEEQCIQNKQGFLITNVLIFNRKVEFLFTFYTGCHYLTIP